ncbi:MAG: hypothetical protein ACHBN1_02455 [Heteroscytonema crispum UTEX LB 1556]
MHSLLTTITALADKQATACQALFQKIKKMTIDEGSSALYFPSEHFIGIVTEPPILL